MYDGCSTWTTRKHKYFFLVNFDKYRVSARRGTYLAARPYCWVLAFDLHQHYLEAAKQTK
jgi:hypothetical protein